jgi:hypothetical protein
MKYYVKIPRRGYMSVDSGKRVNINPGGVALFVRI